MKSIDQDRKKAWKAQQKEVARSAFPASDELLQSPFASVDALVAEQRCDHSLRFTKQWITANRQPEERIVAWLEEHGGHCDCEVVANASDHWEQNR